MITVIDVSGHPTGGAGRWRREAREWLRRTNSQGVRLIGERRRVEPRWLVRREFLRTSCRRIAANNFSFLTGSGPRIVLLRNPLHFLRPGELEALTEARHVARQGELIRGAATRADFVVVPTSAMASRVVDHCPRLKDRLRVRHHPVSPPSRGVPTCHPFILFPQLPAPHKDLVGSLRRLVVAEKLSGQSIPILVTADAGDLGDLAPHPLVHAIGPKTHSEMDSLWATASVAYAPSLIESFCYPVAEARALGIPVLAPDAELHREVGGTAHIAYAADDPASLADSLITALTANVQPDPAPFDPDRYFSWLTSL